MHPNIFSEHFLYPHGNDRQENDSFSNVLCGGRVLIIGTEIPFYFMGRMDFAIFVCYRARSFRKTSRLCFLFESGFPLVQNEIIGQNADRRAAQKEESESPKGVVIRLTCAHFKVLTVRRSAVEIRDIALRNVSRANGAVRVRIGNVIVAVIEGIDFTQYCDGGIFFQFGYGEQRCQIGIFIQLYGIGQITDSRPVNLPRV